MIRKIIAARNTLEHTQTMHLRTISIKAIYQKLLGDNLRVNWKCLMLLTMQDRGLDLLCGSNSRTDCKQLTYYKLGGWMWIKVASYANNNWNPGIIYMFNACSLNRCGKES
uniref:Putative ovule protein n=1 Tax=Solanum chacoense TaxID=4108 RepID=A0A0V0GW96_SOLCH